MNNKNIIIVAIIIAIAFGGAGFYGGMLYGKSQNNFVANGQSRLGQRPGGAGQFGGQGTNGMARRGANGGSFVGGKIISKDDKSITIQSPEGGSKIVFFADSTQIAKSASGTVSDLVNDTQVMVNGTTNPDGSITATMIQMR